MADIYECNRCFGTGVLLDTDDEGVEIPGTEEPCWVCKGDGEYEGCICWAKCSCECSCGSWDSEPCTCYEDIEFPWEAHEDVDFEETLPDEYDYEKDE